MRNFGAKLFNLAEAKKNIKPLVRLLEDQHWWVRYSAAEALLEAGENGREALELAAAGPDENPAAGISRYIMKKGVS
jgi:HEAT repeat protein